jgi:hypothetical protein
MKHRWKLEDIKGLKIIGETPLPPAAKKARNNQFWLTLGNKRKFFRSIWEANYAMYLQWQKEHGLIYDWDHEPDVFYFEGIRRGTTNYLPDFKVWKTENKDDFYYVEVKGYMDRKSKTKINRMRKYYPKIELQVCDGKWFRENAKRISGLIPGWIKPKK